MGRKNKLKRFEENRTFPHFFEPSREELISGRFALKGKWSKEFFKNNHPVVLELGCGKGEYTVALAQKFPEKNFIGIDIKGARMWRGAKTSLALGLKNVAFLRMQIELLDHAFAENEVSEIWITFPDPQQKFKRTKHRLTNHYFLNLYKKILRPEHIIHLKTDSEFLHGYTLGILEGRGDEILFSHHDIYTHPEPPPHVTEIQTFYEKKWLDEGKKITYTRFRLKK